MSAARLRVLVVDDDERCIELIRSVVSGEVEVELVGAREDEEVVAAAPDVVVTERVDLTRRLAAERPGIRVVVLTGSEQDGNDAEAHRAGAVAYVRKSRLADDLPAVLAALAGTRG